MFDKRFAKTMHSINKIISIKSLERSKLLILKKVVNHTTNIFTCVYFRPLATKVFGNLWKKEI
jgi:hypothetical protein